jgi:hypothetical protein
MDVRRVGLVATPILVAFAVLLFLMGRPITASAVFTDPEGSPRTYQATVSSTETESLRITCAVGNDVMGRDQFTFSISEGTTRYTGVLRDGNGAAPGATRVPISCHISN